MVFPGARTISDGLFVRLASLAKLGPACSDNNRNVSTLFHIGVFTRLA